MSWEILPKNTSRYHTQDQSYYCGAATAMMILAEIGVSYSDLDQDDLYSSNHNHNSHSSGWATDAEGLCYTVNNRRPQVFLPNYFIVSKMLTQENGAMELLWTLVNYKVSPGVLVFGGGHWNVVCGARTDQDPTKGNYTIEGFYHQNPIWYDTPPPPPHDGSDVCGSGGAHGTGPDFTTYASWLTDWFTGFNYDDPYGNKQWVSVDDPTPSKIQPPERRPLKYLAQGRELITLQQAVKFAGVGIEEYKLAESGPIEATLKAGKMGAPVVVHRLDHPGDYYYLVPWEQASGIAGFVEVDARFGVLKGFRTLSAPAKHWLIGGESPKNLHSEIAKRVEGLKVELPEERGFVVIRPGTYVHLPFLVWRPCRESWSPALPFYMVTNGSNTVYVRIDGQAFSHLTTNVHGG